MPTNQGIQPWMYDACRATVRSGLHILTLRLNPRRYNNWCDNQLLFAAHLMMMQAQLNSNESGIEQEYAGLDSLLDGAENALENAPSRALVDEMGLAILRNVRQNVGNAIPSS